MVAERKPIVVVGSINIDLVANASRLPTEGETVLARDLRTLPGGKGANQAVAVGRLGYPVRMIGRIGNDAFGTQLKIYLEEASVDTAGVKTTEGSSGAAVIIVLPSGENSIVVTPGANAMMSPQDVERSIGIIRSAGMVLTQLEIPVDTVECLARICAREGVPLMLDPAPATDLSASLFRQVQWFTPNETETCFFTVGRNSRVKPDPVAMARMLLQKGIKGVVLKRGADGAYLESTTEAGGHVDAFAVNAVDSTGAGDAFNGAFATGLMRGMGALASARFAAAAAAVSVTRIGAQSAMPTLEEVEELLRSFSVNGTRARS